MNKKIRRILSVFIIFSGIFFLIFTLHTAILNSLTEQSISGAEGKYLKHFSGLLISLPVPLHIISIGMIIGSKNYSNLWKKIAWFAVIISGIWLGIAVGVRFL